MTRRPAPSDAGRTPFGAPPRLFSDPDRICALTVAGEPFSESVARPARCSRRVGRGARGWDYKSRAQEPLPAPPAGVSPEDALKLSRDLRRMGSDQMCCNKPVHRKMHSRDATNFERLPSFVAT
jgi:hypothetical protein